jgi:hypothetical protein
MVPRSELLAAQSDAKKGKEDSQTMADTISRLQQQLNEARLESAQLHADTGSLVSRASYESTKKQREELEAAAKDEKQKLSSAIQALNERLSNMEDERSKLILSIQAWALLHGLYYELFTCTHLHLIDWKQGMVPRSELYAAR